ncbi:MAG: DUF255 domain-containing protein [Phycisphaeraceae bacterium]|nr:DUF255 domain-containing protein [Phycisphaeraceae bacterium]
MHDDRTAPSAPRARRLADALSPYLRQHAGNPVDWYPWSDEAIERARREDRPIFLSVGYATCYWCHVMEREVFEHEGIARLMNDRLISIKVDREERPDIDAIYMTATQLLTGQGGWPNSVFLTPDLKPFFAGTYFGAEDRHGRPGFGTIVTLIDEAWRRRRAEVESTAGHVFRLLQSALGDVPRADATDSPRRRPGGLSQAQVDAIVSGTVDTLVRRADPAHGGFGGAPKFPAESADLLLLDVGMYRGDPSLRALVRAALDGMSAGGIHDHVGGGFHRYAVDAAWQVPHFEKMLYTQAQMALVCLAMHEATGDRRDADVARGIFRFVDDTLTAESGAFLSGMDAETDGVEGAFHAWTAREIRDVLGAADAAVFLRGYQIAEIPAFPGHPHPEGGVLVRSGPGADDPARTPDLRPMLDRLFEARRRRPCPRIDDKVVIAWNGLMIMALAQGARVLHDPALAARAFRAGRFLRDCMRSADGGLLRCLRGDVTDGRAAPGAPEGYLEDAAALARAYIALAGIDPAPRDRAGWMASAEALLHLAEERFRDPRTGLWFAARARPDLLVRGWDLSDGATPSGSAIMAHAMVDMAERSPQAEQATWADRAGGLLEVAVAHLGDDVPGAVHLVHALHRWSRLARVAARGASGSLESDSRVTLSARRILSPDSAAPGGPVLIGIRMEIEPGWHCVAGRAGDPPLSALQVTIGQRPRDGVGAVAPRAIQSLVGPEPERITRPGDGDASDESVYRGAVELRASVRPATDDGAGDAAPFVVSVVFRVCSDKGACLAPSTWTGVVSAT